MASGGGDYALGPGPTTLFESSARGSGLGGLNRQETATHGNINTRDRYIKCAECGDSRGWDVVLKACTINSCRAYFGVRHIVVRKEGV